MTKLLQSLHKVHIVESVQLLCNYCALAILIPDFFLSARATHPGWQAHSFI